MRVTFNFFISMLEKIIVDREMLFMREKFLIFSLVFINMSCY